MNHLYIRFLRTLLFVLLLSGSAKAQSYVEKMLTYGVTAQYPDHQINAHVKPTGTVRALNDREYYWFSGSQINITQGGYSGKLLNGGYEDLYTNKNLKASGAFDEGLKSGVWKSWTEEGILKDEYTFDKGLKNGAYIKYDTAGKVKEKGVYHQGLLDGKQETVSGDSVMVLHYHHGKIKPQKSLMPKFIRKLLPKKGARTNHPK